MSKKACYQTFAKKLKQYNFSNGNGKKLIANLKHKKYMFFTSETWNDIYSSKRSLLKSIRFWFWGNKTNAAINFEKKKNLHQFDE